MLFYDCFGCRKPFSSGKLRKETVGETVVRRCSKCNWDWVNSDQIISIKDFERMKEQESINNIKRFKEIEAQKLERIEEEKGWANLCQKVNKICTITSEEYGINHTEIRDAIMALRFVIKKVRIYKKTQVKSDEQLMKDEMILTAKIWKKLNEKDGLSFRKIAKDYNVSLGSITYAINKLKRIELNQNNPVNLKVNVESKKAQPGSDNL